MVISISLTKLILKWGGRLVS